MHLSEKVKDFPHAPGIYVMKDADGKVLYVGKAIDLRKRVSSYLKDEGDGRHHIRFLMKRVADVDYVMTDSEKEALLLENTYIKKHRPRYNIHLKDDKTYISIKLTKHRFPRILATRQIRKDGGTYFGPYTSAAAAYETVEFLEKHFRLRNCGDNEFSNRVRPCLQHQIHRCDAPCVGLVSEEGYGSLVQQAKYFLKGQNHELLDIIREAMKRHAENEEYEKAAAARDLIQSLEETLEKQKVEKHAWIDQDVVAVFRQGEEMSWCVMMIRQGKVWETKLHHLRGHEEDEDAMESFLNQHYQERFLPDEILVARDFPMREALAQILSEKKERKVQILVPQKGEKKELVDLALRNAKDAFEHRTKKEESAQEILLALQETLGLRRYPRRIECFDISTLGGQFNVGSLVAFVDGVPEKASYRRFKIRNAYPIEGVMQPNDFLMMKEMLTRRLKRVNRVEGPEKDPKWENPDLIVIDGGKGQLNIVAAVMEELGVTDIDLISLAKESDQDTQDKVFLPGRKNPVLLGKHSNLLHLLMRIRDEAHRFAITYNRQLRGKSFLKPS